MATVFIHTHPYRRNTAAHHAALSYRRTQQGFTLIELAFTTFIIGLLLAMTDVGSIVKLDTRYYATRQETTNRMIASSLLQYARTNTALGTLPAPYTGSGYYSTIFDPTDTTLATLFRSANIAATEINDDGTTGQRVRVYQQVALSQSVPLDFQSGPIVTLNYQYAGIYMTACRKADATCNKTPLAGATTALTSGNYTTWTTTGTDLKAELISTLPLQKQMLSLTNQRLTELRDKLNNLYRTKQLAAAASDTTNQFPYAYQSGVPGTPNPNLAGADAATNQNCYDGWYDLNAANVNILDQLGLSKAQFGSTAWNGAIQYCRDYDPALAGANTEPHYAALRIHKTVSAGNLPDSSVASNNVFITF
jgi:prepilin-type N-terminal cleavage/methylation domain-containing protein